MSLLPISRLMSMLRVSYHLDLHALLCWVSEILHMCFRLMCYLFNVALSFLLFFYILVLFSVIFIYCHEFILFHSL